MELFVVVRMWGHGSLVGLLLVASAQTVGAQCGSCGTQQPGGQLVGGNTPHQQLYDLDSCDGSQSIRCSFLPKIHSLAQNPVTGQIYGANNTHQFFELNESSCGYSIISNDVGYPIEAMAWDSNSGILYGGNASAELFVIDPSDGTRSGIKSGQYSIEGMAFVPSTGKLFGCRQGGPVLFEIDPSDGSHTQLNVTNPTTGVSGMTCLTYNPNVNKLFGGNYNGASLLQIEIGSWVQCPVGNGTFGLEGLVFLSSTPAISSVVPAQGTELVASEVLVTGEGFDSSSRVYFNGVEGDVLGQSATELSVLTPILGPGSYDVTVSNDPCCVSAPLVDGWQVCDASPSVSAIAPSCGPSSGGTLVTITGSGFEDPCEVRFGDEVVAATVIHSGEVTATTPAVPIGASDVRVCNLGPAECGDTCSPALVGGFAFAEPPSILSVAPTQGPTCGGLPLTIMGSGFSEPCVVLVDGVPIACSVQDANTITATTLPHSAGFTDISVETCVGSPATLTNAFEFESVSPTLQGVAPAIGPWTGGTVVTISGSDFCPGATVFFGELESPLVLFVGSNELAVTTPSPGPQGCETSFVFGVRVVNADGKADALPGAFTFEAGSVLGVGEGQPYSSIQAAIDDAQDGDAIVVESYQEVFGELLPAVYTESFDSSAALDTLGKAILLTSSDPSQLPAVQAALSTQRVLAVRSGEGSNTVIACLQLQLGNGGVLVENGSSPTLLENAIHDNFTSGAGGGILVRGGAMPILRRNFVHTNAAQDGGGIAVMDAGSAPTLDDNRVSGNTAAGHGGGVYLGVATEALLVSVPSGGLGYVQDNRAAGNGGGIYCGRTALTRRIEGVPVLRNEAEGMGGGIYVEAGSIVEILNNTISANNPDAVLDGRLHGSGGGIAIDGSTFGGTEVVIRGNLITGNRCDAPCAMGGGIFIQGLADSPGFGVLALVLENTIRSNSAQVGGGLVINEKVTALVRRNVITFNAVGLVCTEIAPCSEGSHNCPWQSPLAETPDVLAPGVFARDCTLFLVNNTLHGNSGGSPLPSGGGLHLMQQPLPGSYVKSNIFSANDGFEIALESGASLQPSQLTYNDFYHVGLALPVELVPGAGTLFLDPRFVNASEVSPDFGLKAGSPCIDAGDPTTPAPLNGWPIVDMGAIEFDKSPDRSTGALVPASSGDIGHAGP